MNCGRRVGNAYVGFDCHRCRLRGHTRAQRGGDLPLFIVTESQNPGVSRFLIPMVLRIAYMYGTLREQMHTVMLSELPLQLLSAGWASW